VHLGQPDEQIAAGIQGEGASVIDEGSQLDGEAQVPAPFPGWPPDRPAHGIGKRREAQCPSRMTDDELRATRLRRRAPTPCPLDAHQTDVFAGHHVLEMLECEAERLRRRGPEKTGTRSVRRIGARRRPWQG